jgi:hypothetical protein
LEPGWWVRIHLNGPIRQAKLVAGDRTREGSRGSSGPLEPRSGIPPPNRQIPPTPTGRQGLQAVWASLWSTKRPKGGP